MKNLRCLPLARTGRLFGVGPAALRGVAGIPIDHVLANRHWLRISSARGPDLGSDHLPGLARLRLADQAAQARTAAQVTAIGPPFDPVAPLIGAGEKM